MDQTQIGMTAKVHNLWRKTPTTAWEECGDENIDLNPTSIPASAKFALIVRRDKRAGDDGVPVLVLCSITIQSALIKKQLGPVFAGYEGINTNLRRVNFDAPFREFYYRWDRFLDASPDKTPQAAGDGDSVGDNDASEDVCSIRTESQKHYDLLFNVLNSEVTPHIEHMNDLLHNGVVSYDYLWALFQPGTEIYSKSRGAASPFHTVPRLIPSAGTQVSSLVQIRRYGW